MNTHKQTVYLVQDEKGKLEIIQYAPTMDYSGRSDRDQYALMQGLFIDEISHDLWVGEVKCHRNIATSFGIETMSDLTRTIVAKESFTWDMSKPMGQRKSDVKQTSNWISALATYHNQKKAMKSLSVA